MRRNFVKPGPSRLVGGSCNGCLAAVRSWDGFRHSLSRRRPCTNLIIHHGVTNIVGQTGQCLRILNVVEKTRDFSAFCQRFQVSEGLFQFPRNCASGSILTSIKADYFMSFCLLFISLTSPSGAGVPSDSARPSTRGTKDSIDSRFAIACWSV